MIDRIAGRLVIASISGGKDSAAMSLHLRELGIEHRRVFMDTGWEHEATYDYLRGELTRVIGPIEEIRGPMTMEEIVRHKAMFPSRQRRWCTDELKVKPMKRYVSALLDEGHDPVNAVGVRADESLARSRLVEWERTEHIDCDVWRPLLRWSVDDVIAIHKRHGLRPNPLYLQGAERVGCWPCIMSRKSEIRFVADRDPARIDRLRVLEHDVSEAAGSQRSWFQPPTSRVGTMPIDAVVAWARTPHGMPNAHGQGELFAPGAGDDGCMRWGMCDTPAKDSA